MHDGARMARVVHGSRTIALAVLSMRTHMGRIVRGILFSPGTLR